MPRSHRRGPFTNDEINRIRELAASPRSGYGDVKRLAASMGRCYHMIYRSVREHRRRMAEQEGLVSSVPCCDAMIHSGRSYAALMSRLLAEPMPGPDHGQTPQSA